MPSVDVSTRHRVCKLATCNLNQWAMDFEGNLERVIRSIQEVCVQAFKALHATHSSLISVDSIAVLS